MFKLTSSGGAARQNCRESEVPIFVGNWNKTVFLASERVAMHGIDVTAPKSSFLQNAQKKHILDVSLFKTRRLCYFLLMFGKGGEILCPPRIGTY